MKILIIGNSNHQYVINFSKHFKAQYHGNVIIDTISLYTITNKDVYMYFDKVYAPHYNVLDRIPKLKHPYRKYVLKKLAKKNFGNYDICHIQSFEKNTEIFEQIIKEGYLIQDFEHRTLTGNVNEFRIKGSDLWFSFHLLEDSYNSFRFSYTVFAPTVQISKNGAITYLFFFSSYF